jgi:protein-tyrosine phosphatase
MYNFTPASDAESIVFGAARPRYDEAGVHQWIEFMQNQGIQRVCCLLCESQLANYADLLDRYRQSFGIEQVCWAPIEDFQIVNPELLMQTVLPFLAVSDQIQAPIVVHCAGGIGRTGQVLTAWLIAGRGFSRQAAIEAVRQTGRNPYEAAIVAPLKGRNPWKVSAELDRLLEGCHLFKLPK